MYPLGSPGRCTQTNGIRKHPNFHVWSSISPESAHGKTYKMACGPSEDSNQPGIRPVWSESSLCAQWVAKDPSFLYAYSDYSDQTRRMLRLIFVARTCHFVGFVMRWLSCPVEVSKSSWVSGKQFRPWSNADFSDTRSGSKLFALACLSNYIASDQGLQYFLRPNYPNTLSKFWRGKSQV